MYNFGELKSKVGILDQRSGDSAYLTKIGDWINYAQEFAYKEYDYYAELEDKFFFTTVASQEGYYLPSSFDKPLRVYNMTSTNKLQMWTEEGYEDSNLSNIANSNTGTPSKARLYGISPINTTIAAIGTTTQVKSSSLLDTAGVIVRIEGYIDSACTVIDYEDITISTGSPTSFSAAVSPKTFYKYTRIAKSADTTGFITVANTSGTTMALIASTERQSRYPVLNLGIIPNAAFSMRILFKRRINKMINDNDYPFIDADEFYITYATALAYAEETKTADQSANMMARAKEILLTVIRNQQTRLGEDYQHKMVTTFTQAHRS